MRYQNSLLGVLWVLIKPYTTFVVMYFLWSKIGRQSVENYEIYLLIGIIFYTYLNELLVYGNMALVEKAHIILKVNFPRQIAIISSLFSAVINLGINLILVFAIMALNNIAITLEGLVILVFVTGIIFVFGMAFAMFASIINVRFRDLSNLTELGLFLLYWITPILFVPDPNLFGGAVNQIMLANPVGVLLNQVRAGFDIWGSVDIGTLFAYLVAGLILFGIGWRFFSYQIKRVAEYF